MTVPSEKTTINGHNPYRVVTPSYDQNRKWAYQEFPYHSNNIQSWDGKQEKFFVLGLIDTVPTKKIITTITIGYGPRAQ
jgi:hypothetical protein